ncbi:hypothetical protein BN946_scf184857.g2, partial [Trametes cinnabarina]
MGFRNIDEVISRLRAQTGSDRLGFWKYFLQEDAYKNCEQNVSIMHPFLVRRHLMIVPAVFRQIDSFIQLLYPVRPEIWTEWVMPSWKSEEWVEANRTPGRPSWLSQEEYENLRKALAESGLKSQLNYYKVAISDANIEEDNKIPKEAHSVWKPALFIAASKDFINVPAIGRAQMAQYVPDAKIVELNVGHWAFLEATEEVNRELEAWLDSLGFSSFSFTWISSTISVSTMDVDIADDEQHQQQLSQLQGSRAAGKRTVVVDDAHPFELEAYISSYSGKFARTYIDRLLHIMSVCPLLAPQALQLAIEEALKGRDTTLYQEIFHRYQRAYAEAGDEIPELSALAEPDQQWIEETNAKNQAERTKLEVELKTYSSNMIKESIRMAHRDLGDFYRSVGEHNNALKHYTKSREFCTTSQHLLDMCMSIIETGPEAPAGAAQAQKEKKNAERLKVQTKLDIATGLSHLGQNNYEKAAQTLLKAGPMKGLEEWTGKLIAPGDIAIYATLCALATFPRSTIRAQILDNEDFGTYIEQEPYIRELLESYISNRFKTVLEILERYSTRHYLDIHLYQHVQNLTNLIRSKSLVLYFQPFSAIKLERMSQAFGWSVDELEQQIVALIQSGEIKARVDRQNKVGLIAILKAKETDQRAALFAKAIKSGQEMQAANRKLLLRMRLYVPDPVVARLQQADLVVKPPKGQQQGFNFGGGHPSELLGGDY